jgi:CHAT domain-containing protein
VVKILRPTRQHIDVALSLQNVAVLHRARRDYVHAEPLYQRALAIREKALGPEHPDVANSLKELALLYQFNSDRQKALPLMMRGMRIEEHNLGLILATGSENQKRAYVAKLSGSTNVNISLFAVSAPGDRQALDLALTTVLQRKGRVLEVLTDSTAALRRRLNPQDRELLNQLFDVRSQLATLALNGPGKMSFDQYRAQRQKQEERAERLESAMSSRSAEFRALSQPVTIERVQALLPEGAALVELVSYVRYDFRLQIRGGKPSYAAYVLAHEGAPAGLDLGEAAPIDSAVSALRAALRDPKRQDVKERARDLDQKVMRPIRNLLGNTRTVLLSPDGALNLVPFGARMDEQGHYLNERYSFTYLTSGRDLLRLQIRAPARQGPMIVADPQFDLRSASSAASQAAARRSLDLGSIDYPPLPGTAEEANELKRILPGAKALIGVQATEAALKQVQGPVILHIATHGFFLRDQTQPVDERRLLLLQEPPASAPLPENPLLRSGLVFAGVKNGWSGNGEDGVLTALEASSLDLVGTKLVVLSACDTGVGDVVNGEGVYGLRRALVLAGAESQVISLWPVSDEATRELMRDYYERLQAGEGRTEAMRHAQLKMQERSSRRHPFYWAGFIQSGNWTGL